MKKPDQNLNDNVARKRLEQPSPVTNTSHYSLLLILLLAVACFWFPSAPSAFAVSPPPDGGYPGNNTAEGDNALFSLTSGINNTAVGANALLHDTSGSYNMAVGSRALAFNMTGSFNMAIGADALYSNTSSNSNTAIGFRVLYFNTIGNNLTGVGAGALYRNAGGVLDTAVGAAALHDNTGGNFNTAAGAGALQSNISGSMNTAIGYQALFSQTAGTHDANAHNTAIGVEALYNNNGGGFCTAVGDHALFSYTQGPTLEPGFNTAVGQDALVNATGDGNTALGAEAGLGITTANNVICIGTGGGNEDNSCYIGNIAGADATGGDPVFVTSEGKLGTVNVPSAVRFKEEIKPMNEASKAILALKPVTFRYKKEFDPRRIPQFGLVAEEVEKVDPNLVKRDRDGKLQTVRYETVNAMLLNEFLKEHRKVEEQGCAIQEQKDKIDQLKAAMVKQEATIVQQQKDFQSAIVRQRQRFELTLAEQEKKIAALTSGLQKLSAQIRLVKPAPQVAANNP